MKLSDIVEQDERLRKWETFIPGFDVEIEYLPRDDLRKMRRKCTKGKWRGGQRIEEVDEELFVRELAARIISWRGLTTEILGTLFPLKATAITNGVEVECSDENKIFMLQKAYGFDEFVLDALTTLQDAKEEQLDEEVKNSDALSPEN